MMVASLSDNDELLLNAYCDGELDLVSANEFERRLASDQSLKARYARLMALRQTVRSLPQPELPASLQARIQSRLDAERASNVRFCAIVAGRFRPWLRQRCSAQCSRVPS